MSWTLNASIRFLGALITSLGITTTLESIYSGSNLLTLALFTIGLALLFMPEIKSNNRK